MCNREQDQNESDVIFTSMTQEQVDQMNEQIDEYLTKQEDSSDDVQ